MQGSKLSGWNIIRRYGTNCYLELYVAQASTCPLSFTSLQNCGSSSMQVLPIEVNECCSLYVYLLSKCSVTYSCTWCASMLPPTPQNPTCVLVTWVTVVLDLLTACVMAPCRLPPIPVFKVVVILCNKIFNRSNPTPLNTAPPSRTSTGNWSQFVLTIAIFMAMANVWVVWQLLLYNNCY